MPILDPITADNPQQHINLGTPPAGVDGDTDRAAWVKAETNFTTLFNLIYGGEAGGAIIDQVNQNTADIVTLKAATDYTGGNLKIGADTLAGAAFVTVDAAAGQNRGMVYQTAGVKRWQVGVDATAETGANAGSNYVFNRYADDGTLLGQAFTLDRVGGFATLPSGLLTIGNDNLATPARIWMNGAALQQKKIQFQTAGKGRWEVGCDADVESGGDAGSSFYLYSMTDAGAAKMRVFQVRRTDGVAQLYSGGLFIGSDTLSGAAQCILDNAGGGGRNFVMQTAGKNRWTVQANAAAETGSNAGSDFVIAAYGDNGANISIPITISRANGAITCAPIAVNTANPNTFALNLNASYGGGIHMKDGVYDICLYSTGGMLNIGASQNNAATVSKWTCDPAGNTNQSGSCTLKPPGVESDLQMGYAGSLANGNYLSCSSGSWGLNFYNASQGYGGGVMTWYRGSSMAMSCGVVPAVDNTYTLGTAGSRWTAVYAAGGVITSSDRRLKTDFTPNALGLDFINSLPIKQFRLIESEQKVTYTEPPLSYDDDGNPIPQNSTQVVTAVPGVRTHIGPLSQDIHDAFEGAGIDPRTMAAWCLTDPDDPNSLQMIRADELLWTLFTAVQELSAQVKALQSAAAIPDVKQ